MLVDARAVLRITDHAQSASSSTLTMSKTSVGGNRGGKDGVEIKGLTATWLYGVGSVITHPKDGPPSFKLTMLDKIEQPCQ